MVRAHTQTTDDGTTNDGSNSFGRTKRYTHNFLTNDDETTVQFTTTAPGDPHTPKPFLRRRTTTDGRRRMVRGGIPQTACDSNYFRSENLFAEQFPDNRAGTASISAKVPGGIQGGLRFVCHGVSVIRVCRRRQWGSRDTSLGNLHFWSFLNLLLS